MALATIRPKTAHANISINAVEYREVMSFARVTSNAPLLPETVFSTENVGGESSVGTEILSIELTGIMKRGARAAGPLIPLPQNIAITVEWDDGCSIAIPSANFTQASAARAAGGIGTIDGFATSSGAFTKSWNTSS